MKILVVEDSASMRSYLASIIESGTNDRDLEIVEAATGFEALKTLPHHKFDAILTDINMPDINGLELVSFLKNHPVYKMIPIMVISTESTMEDRNRAAALGAEARREPELAASAIAQDIAALRHARLYSRLYIS